MELKPLKLMDAVYDKTSGISCVSVRSSVNEQIYCGTAFLNKKTDIDYASQNFGCQIAEIRATIEAYKAEIGEFERMKQFLSKYKQKYLKQIIADIDENIKCRKEFIQMTSKENILKMAQKRIEKINHFRDARQKQKDNQEKFRQILQSATQKGV